MAEIINLNKVRKARAKADKAKRAGTNRAQFGLAKADKNLSKAKRDKSDKDLDGKKRED